MLHLQLNNYFLKERKSVFNNMFHSIYKNPSLNFPVRGKKQMLNPWLSTQYGLFLLVYLEVS